MCGLIGAIVPPGGQVGARVNAGLVTLRHRGPDHQEARVFGLAGREVWLGHARLSIIDLNDAANQPMCSDDGRYALVFNGEIYNYIELREELRAMGCVFRTRSDTEVLLHAWMHWGEACLDRLDGMFAFVVLDTVKMTLTCVRDAFGIKPLFYSVYGGAFFFASELPAILDLLPTRPGVDLQRAYDYLVHGDYDSNEHTFVEGVTHLLPAHVMTLDVGSGLIRSLRRWWSPSIEQTSRLSFKDAAEAVREQFLGSIRRQLRSDVPLGAALSGGIDSSAVVCAMRHLEPDLPIHTFSYVASDAAISEERWMDVVNQHVGAVAHKVHASARDLAHDMDDLVLAQGEPFGGTSIYAQYRVFKCAKEQGITVTLDGQGADEMLAGYTGYAGQRIKSLIDKRQFGAAWEFLSNWAKWPNRSLLGGTLRAGAQYLDGPLYQFLYGAVVEKVAPSWLNVGHLRDAGVVLRAPRSRSADGDQSGRRVMAALADALQRQGLQSLLRHGDRNSMRFSVESRVPFLTLGMTSFLLSLPEEYLISPQGETKSVFREAMTGIVPRDILNRRDKIGFQASGDDWMLPIASEVSAWLHQDLNLPFIKQSKICEEFDAIVAGKKKASPQVWRWANFLRWYSVFMRN